jgi:hypothetical protein
VVSMQAVAGYRQRSAMVLAVMLLGALVTVPSSAAQGGGGMDRGAMGRAPIERFLAISTSSKPNANPVLLGFGPIHAKGVDKAVSNHKDIFRFPRGNLIVRHQRVARSRDHDPKTCLFEFSERGTYKVVRGTGAYVGAHGHGHYVVNGKFVACKNQPPEASFFQIRARGPLQL